MSNVIQSFVCEYLRSPIHCHPVLIASRHFDLSLPLAGHLPQKDKLDMVEDFGNTLPVLVVQTGRVALVVG